MDFETAEKEKEKEKEKEVTIYKIPRKIFQTHKSIEYIQGKPQIGNAINSWRKCVPEFGYYFYSNDLCEQFMRDEMGGDIYKAYSRLPIPVMKADLWRYCVIYKYGGIYADTDTIRLVDPNIFLHNDALLMIVPENSTHLCNWIFSAPPESPIIKSIIDLSVKRILSIVQIKGEHIVHHLTGPGVFTDGIESYLYTNNKPVFKDKKQYFNYPDQCLAVFNYNRFHTKAVKHLFMGSSSEDGWFNDRNKRK